MTSVPVNELRKLYALKTPVAESEAALAAAVTAKRLAKLASEYATSEADILAHCDKLAEDHGWLPGPALTLSNGEVVGPRR